MQKAYSFLIAWLAALLAGVLALAGCAAPQDSARETTSSSSAEPATSAAPSPPEPTAPPESIVPPEPPAPEPPAEASAPAANPALALLDTLEVKGRAPKTGYARDQFGQRWKDVDRNGCDQRNDVLARDMVEFDAPKGCKVLSGVLMDPYSGQRIDFVRGQDTSRAVQIDHVVALADAWQKGAQQLSPEEREQFANDPLNLLAVDGPLNQQKGAGDAATWLPPNREFRCQYVTIQTEVKAKYRLWVTEAEKQAIAGVLAGC
ncbi:MAG TPA: HNH endonuclease family protein [Candidatus Corynebacterium gallistercoris]|uniref:HNH endonuclease family protein n=1 Tax=Candidatus Corynebacterium gallistercoris TaxID=2838530 RepID=A0A9D1RY05_9CORY|nr:HNH endonuclease family protein [Candidatus Corynebacterium gallistercoris]